MYLFSLAIILDRTSYSWSDVDAKKDVFRQKIEKFFMKMEGLTAYFVYTGEFRIIIN